MISVKDLVRIDNLEAEVKRLSKEVKHLVESLERLWEVAKAEQDNTPKREILTMKGRDGRQAK